jgi:hypothetical protein
MNPKTLTNLVSGAAYAAKQSSAIFRPETHDWLSLLNNSTHLKP